MTSKFDACIPHILREEGGYSDHPKDPGGATMKGVIQRVYDAYRRGHGFPQQHVRLISDAEVHDIYKRNYWNVVAGDHLPAGIDLAVFDFGVNSGPSRSIKYLQRILKVKIDGQMGPVTIAAAHDAKADEVISQLCRDRLNFVRRIKHAAPFIKGWTRRISRVKANSLKMAEGLARLDREEDEDESLWTTLDATDDDQATSVAAPLPKADSGGQPKTSMAKSKTGIAAAIAGSTAALSAAENVGSTASQVSQATDKVATATTNVSTMMTTLINAVQNPIFIFGCIGIVVAIYVFRERQRKMEDLES